MSPVNTIISRLAAWLAAQTFSPALREVALAPGVPSAYPHLLVSATGEQFGPTPQDSTLTLSLRISAASGRPDSALSSARELAHSIRSALLASGNAAGAGHALRVGSISYGIASTAEPVVATAELAVEVRYVVV